MKFSLAVVSSLMLCEHTLAFVAPQSPLYQRTFSGSSSKSRLQMALDMPPASPAPQGNSNLPVIQANPYGQPTDVRYSDFLRLVNGDRIEKVTFSSDGTQLLGVDVDGVRLKIEALPNDPELLTQLTTHKVCADLCFFVFVFEKVLCNLITILLSILNRSM